MSQHIASSLLTSAPSLEAGPAGEHKSANWLRRLINAVSASQQARADRIVGAHLARQSDSTLEALGFNHKQIEELRAGAAKEAIWPI